MKRANRPNRQDSRNRDILKRVQQGESYQTLAHVYKIGVTRVQQIVQRELNWQQRELYNQD